MQRRQLKHVLFTEPADLKAGQEVTLYYSPLTTNLAGRRSIYVTGGPPRLPGAAGAALGLLGTAAKPRSAAARLVFTPRPPI